MAANVEGREAEPGGEGGALEQALPAERTLREAVNEEDLRPFGIATFIVGKLQAIRRRDKALLHRLPLAFHRFCYKIRTVTEMQGLSREAAARRLSCGAAHA